jgi:glutamyl-tRNA synthetase
MITRFAPSPTGKLHIGSVRTALFCYLLSQKAGAQGKYILRIEDTDTARSTKLFEENILEGFQWLGLDRDAGPGKNDETGPYYQIQRLEIYNRYLQQLLEDGQAYYAWETTEELDAMREEMNKKKQPFRYRQQEYSEVQLATFKEEERVPVVRLKVDPTRDVVFEDLVKGETRFSMSQFGDFVIVKSDGIPTYHFAVVVDDIEMNITHVVRGEDHLTNTAKHIVLYEAF